jgi:cytoskeletal protein CcmA (bactofilin family)
MWKKDEGPIARSTEESTPRAATPRPTSEGSGKAAIGPSIRIKGDVTGSEDLLIQGEVDGSVTLADHTVSVGPTGRVHADIVGRVITIEGSVEGDLTAHEQIALLGSASVKGDIKAPRVVLEDGATFRGLVDMGVKSEDSPPVAKARGVKSSVKSNSAAVGSSTARRSAGGGSLADETAKETPKSASLASS